MDEVIVIDSGSSDSTVKISESLGAKVIHNDWNGYGKQKRFGEDVCKHNWLLNLDGDEIVSKELNYEIRELFENNLSDKYKFFTIKRQNIFPYGINPYSQSGDKVIRLYQKSFVRYPDHPTWDKIKKPKDYASIVLKGVIYHYWMKDFEHQISKMNRYTTSLANNSPQKSMFTLTLRMIFGFQFDFLKAYFLRNHWIQGRYGFAVAMLYAFTRFMRIIKMMEQKLQKNDPKF